MLEQMSNIRSRIWNVRGISFLVLLVYIINMYMLTLYDAMELLGGKVNVSLFPFLLNDSYFHKLFLLLVLLFYADAPFMEKNQMYSVLRIGKQRWNKRNITYIFISSFLLVLCAEVLTMIHVLPIGEFSNTWNKVSRTIALTDIGNSIYFGLDYTVMKQFSPIELFVYGFLSTQAVVMFFGMLMYTVSLCGGRIWAYTVSAAVLFIPQITFLMMFHSDISYFSPAEWMRCKWWRGEANPAGMDLLYIILATGVLLVVLSVIAEWKVQKADWEAKNDK
ncbi:MAG: hypothetical protein J6A92_05600 [Lachnospiraceae bacterium]|nr:hypothetical protein [Lachnospiraceae bacterium]